MTFCGVPSKLRSTLTFAYIKQCIRNQFSVLPYILLQSNQLQPLLDWLVIDLHCNYSRSWTCESWRS